MPEKSVSVSRETSTTVQPTAKKPYQKPVLVKLGTLRDLTLKKNSIGQPDGKRNRFTGRGGHYEIR